MLTKLTEINKLNAYNLIKNRMEMARLEQVENNNRHMSLNSTKTEFKGNSFIE